MESTETALTLADGQTINREKELEMLSKFIVSEELYADMSLLKNNMLEDSLRKEFQEAYQVHNVLPLYYEK